MRRLFKFLVLIAVCGLGVFWFLTRPQALPNDALAGLTPDVTHGESVFWAAGCASCHATPDARGADRLVLSGGQSFPSDFGTFIAPNISSDSVEGIGSWSALDLANAMTRGVSPNGQHYYPVFPYTSYNKASLQDVVDLRGFLATLPSSNTPSQPQNVGFPFNIRRLLGGWKWLFMSIDWVVKTPPKSVEERGRYLVEALGHCAECHTPRNFLGGLKRDQWLAGGPIPGGKGRFPNLTPGALTWSEQDLAYYFETGFTPDFDSAGGHMALVVENLAHATPEDRAAIAAYLQIVPGVKE
ncbi:MAG: cytochrome c [Rhodobacteraceae bacterium]|nr:cytochrome c [Paracoccaceae bacterium]